MNQAEQDALVENFYDHWKAKYVKTTPTGDKYISTADVKDFEGGDDRPESTSEGHGYGMMITVLMAGYDLEAKANFDAMLRYYKKHVCKTNADYRLMIWAQDKNFNDQSDDAATDGDMDIAYSLILADRQWGSQDSINYLDLAKKMLNAIAKYEINKDIFSIKLGNAIEDASSGDYYSMRTSDFMPSHFRSFLKITNDPIWEKIIDSNYSTILKMQSTFSPLPGLVPDYMVHLNKNAKPHSGEKGRYEFNACRVPWRIGLDNILYGDQRAKEFCDRMNKWLVSNSGKPLYNINEGYKLDGEPLSTQDDLEKFEAMEFLCPFMVSEMCSNEQEWLNKLWTMTNHFDMASYKKLDYYDNTIKMISLIILSKNYWVP